MNKTTVDMHPDCVELRSGEFRIAVTTRVGPRVIGAFLGKSPNLFRVMPVAPLPGVATDFRLYGGHRLWHAPEAMPRTYAPDNRRVKVTEKDGGIEFATPAEPTSGIEKSIHIEPLGAERFRLTHRLTNRNLWTVELAPWALSVMAPGGFAVIPQHHEKPADPFTPDRALVLWAYSNFDDPRIAYGKDYILFRQDPKAAAPCKIGFNAERGWVAYVNQGVALVKTVEYFADAEYPDNGCNVESYSCADFLEIETLGPLYDLDPGETAEHVEVWTGIAGLPRLRTEADVAKHLEPRLAP